MTRLYGSVFLPLILLCFATPALKAQSISVLNEPLTLSAGATSIDIYIQTPQRPSGKPNTSLVIKNLNSSSDKFSQDDSPQPVGSTPNTMIWRTVWKLGETPPFNKTRLVLLAQWGDLSSVLTINITKEEEGQVRFSISSANLRTRYDKSVKIQAIANYVITSPEIDTSSLVDGRTGRILSESNFQIATCASPSPRPDSSSHQVISNLCVTLKDGGIASGKYDGALILGTSGRSNLGSIQLTVYSTSVCDQWLGVLCLFLGILCFFVFSVVIKGYNRWLLALLPAERLLGTVTTLRMTTESSAKDTTFTFPHLLSNLNAPGSLVQLEKDLSKDNLRKLGYLPSLIANPFAQSDLSSEYRVFLTVRSAQIESLKLIVDWGWRA